MVSRLQASFWNTKSSQDHCRVSRGILQRKAKTAQSHAPHHQTPRRNRTRQLNTSTKGQREAHGQHTILFHVLDLFTGKEKGRPMFFFFKKTENQITREHFRHKVGVVEGKTMAQQAVTCFWVTGFLCWGLTMLGGHQAFDSIQKA